MQSWRTIFSREKLESCLSKVTLVGYSEKVDVFGLVQVSPVSAGYCIGSSNWIIASESSGVRIGYVSGSSTLATHPKPFDKVRRCHADIFFTCKNRMARCLICNQLSFHENCADIAEGCRLPVADFPHDDPVAQSEPDDRRVLSDSLRHH